jgi:hypothetical protein
MFIYIHIYILVCINRSVYGYIIMYVYMNFILDQLDGMEKGDGEIFKLFLLQNPLKEYC